MADDTVKCRFCGGDAKHWHDGRMAMADIGGYRCPTCGNYQITMEAGELVERLDAKRRSMLSAFVRERMVHRLHEPRFVTSVRNVTPTPNSVGIDDAIASFPATVAERLDRTLLNLAYLSDKPGANLVIKASDYPIAFAEDLDVLSFILGQLSNTSQITRSGGPVGQLVQLTADGWNRIADLERGVAGLKPLQAFVAMAFAPDGRAERESGLTKGIRDAGYEPRIIDQKEFLGKIDDEIIAEIRKSRFVVADLSLQRNSVYFEAGFAEGLSIPVIYTCIKAEVDGIQCAFDKRQENMIAWETAVELATRLRLRIEATIRSPVQPHKTYPPRQT